MLALGRESGRRRQFERRGRGLGKQPRELYPEENGRSLSTLSGVFYSVNKFSGTI